MNELIIYLTLNYFWLWLFKNAVEQCSSMSSGTVREPFLERMSSCVCDYWFHCLLILPARTITPVLVQVYGLVFVSQKGSGTSPSSLMFSGFAPVCLDRLDFFLLILISTH